MRDQLPKKLPAVQVVRRKVYVVDGVELKTEAEARYEAAFERISKLGEELARLIVESGNADVRSIVMWLMEHRSKVRQLLDRADAAEASVLLIPLKEGIEAEPLPNRGSESC